MVGAIISEWVGGIVGIRSVAEGDGLRQPAPKPSRPEAIRRLLAEALAQPKL